MKVILKKISVSILSLMVLFSSMSFVIDTHYCGENLVDISYFGNADSCSMEKMSMNNSDIKKMKKCCKDETTLMESSKFNKEKVFALQYVDIKFVAAFAYSYINSYQNIDLEKEYFKDFSPPDFDEDIQVLQQVFLI